tara:strand:+ start:1186 stop:1344 length:159 start_codon:yes stop_codon:yes gene_type:complete
VSIACDLAIAPDTDGQIGFAKLILPDPKKKLHASSLKLKAIGMPKKNLKTKS